VLAEYALPPDEVGARVRPSGIALLPPPSSSLFCFGGNTHRVRCLQDLEQHFGEVGSEGCQVLLHAFNGSSGVSPAAFGRLLRDLEPCAIVAYDLHLVVTREVVGTRGCFYAAVGPRKGAFTSSVPCAD
jgi:hypothetical protein